MSKYYTIEHVNDGDIKGWRSVKVTKRSTSVRTHFKLLSTKTHKKLTKALLEISTDIGVNINPYTQHLRVEVKDNE